MYYIVKVIVRVRERKEENDGMQGDKEGMRARKSTFPIHSFCYTTHRHVCRGTSHTCNRGTAGAGGAAAAPPHLHATTRPPRRRRRRPTCTYPCASKPLICAGTNNLTVICTHNGNAEDA